MVLIVLSIEWLDDPDRVCQWRPREITVEDLGDPRPRKEHILGNRFATSGGLGNPGGGGGVLGYKHDGGGGVRRSLIF